MFFINYILFLLIILFTHIIALSTQLLSSKKYFFGVYINEITMEEELKNKINKDFKVKLNISLILSIIIYLILSKSPLIMVNKVTIIKIKYIIREVYNMAKNFIAFEKEILYNATGGNWKMGKYERDNLSLDNQVVKSNKMIQRKI